MSQGLTTSNFIAQDNFTYEVSSSSAKKFHTFCITKLWFPKRAGNFSTSSVYLLASQEVCTMNLVNQLNSNIAPVHPNLVT
jgi:hypothetical protein